MKVFLKGYENVTPKNKAPFTMLHVCYPKNGAVGQVVESCYVSDGFPLPQLKLEMTLNIDRDSRGFLVSVEEVEEC
jgi:hypothetical protein